VLKKRDVPNYWTLAEYVSLVVDVVPDMLMHKHRLQLLLGLRARYILELCRNDLMDRDLILSHLEKIKSCPLVDEPGPDIVVNFVELIHSLLKDPEARQEFFTEVFPVEYGTQYDNDLQTLFSEFIYRLNQLLPVPDMEQRTVYYSRCLSDNAVAKFKEAIPVLIGRSGGRLALPSLRLLAPPLQLMMASMWKVLKKRDVPNYWTLAEYVSLVVDVVPDMLMHKHRLQLLLGLRARYILELCRNDLMDRDLILSHLEKIKSCPLVNVDEPGPDIVVNFVELIHSLLKDPEARQEFFTEVFPVEYGTQYDNDLQTLFSEFIYRLNQLLPVPDMEQLMMASMWKVLKKRDVPNYWTLAEYVSLVVDVVPDMLMHKHRLQLLLGLRARYILELCRNDLMDRDLILSHLEKIKSCPLVDEPGPDIVVNFVELIHSLLKDPEARQEFFTEVFPVEYGTQYDNDLQTLFSEFIYRLNQLLPVPDMEQVR
ncbi:hypothetical protein D4764_0276980, partial [Takifugu flavidus]